MTVVDSTVNSVGAVGAVGRSLLESGRAIESLRKDADVSVLTSRVDARVIAASGDVSGDIPWKVTSWDAPLSSCAMI